LQHHSQTNDLRAGFKVAKWRVFCHSAWLQISPARVKQVYSDKACAVVALNVGVLLRLSGLDVLDGNTDNTVTNTNE
jgi:hypothetical protein